MIIPHLITDILLTAWDILGDVSPWLVVSFVMAGLLRQFLDPAKFQRALGNKGLPAVIKATLSGMLLPICSCGVIPLGLGMYYTGAYLGPTLAFMVATPIINPAAILLAYGLLGPQIATIYLIGGFLVPIAIGIIGNLLAGDEIHAPGMDAQIEQANLEGEEKISISEKVSIGFKWGMFELGTMVGKYIVFGVLLAGILIAAIPQHLIQGYLGNPGMISILGIAILGSVIYVCAVGHIPFVAALVATGAAPGVAITFLMTGAATNLPELISIYKMIGKRAVMIYSSLVVFSSLIIGWLTNQYLLPGFIPFYNLDKSQNAIGLANRLIVSVPEPIQTACSIVILLLFMRAYKPFAASFWQKAMA
ncbi:MAG: efflux transporter SaoE [Desulforhopalus sp.]